MEMNFEEKYGAIDWSESPIGLDITALSLWFESFPVPLQTI